MTLRGPHDDSARTLPPSRMHPLKHPSKRFEAGSNLNPSVTHRRWVSDPLPDPFGRVVVLEVHRSGSLTPSLNPPVTPSRLTAKLPEGGEGVGDFNSRFGCVWIVGLTKFSKGACSSSVIFGFDRYAHMAALARNPTVIPLLRPATRLGPRGNEKVGKAIKQGYDSTGKDDMPLAVP